jgi:hypothetical protein
MGLLETEGGLHEDNNWRDGRTGVEDSGRKKEVAGSKLPQILKEKGEIVYQALGWLAKEDKIEFRKKEGKTLVSLSFGEREIFKKSRTT